MIKLICTDIDNTLVRSQDSIKDVSDKLGRFIEEKAKPLGIQMMLASGRPLADVYQMFGTLTDNVIVSSYDGALCTLGKTILFSREIDKNIYMAFADEMAKALADDTEFVFASVSAIYVMSKKGVAEKALAGAKSMQGKIHYVATAGEINEPVYKMIMVTENPGTDYDYIVEKWDNYVNCVLCRNGWCEFVAGGIDKGFALNMVAERFGIPKDEMVAFGDGENDLSMLKSAGISYAMKDSFAEKENFGGSVTSDVFKSINSLLG